MTKLTLNDACLLEISGEMSEKASLRLQDYLARHPHARARYEQMKQQYALVSAASRVELSEKVRSRVAGAIKSGIQQKLQHKRREEASRRRAKLIYQSLAGISAAAAGLIIVAGLWVVTTSIHEQREQEQISAVDRFVQMVQRANRPSDWDVQADEIEESIEQVQSDTSRAAVEDGQMHTLMSTLGTLASESDEIMPPPEPGAL